MRQVASTVLVLLVAGIAGACGPAEPDEATLEDYCATIHQVYATAVEQTPEGVLVTWDADTPIRDPETYVVYRRPAETTQWQQVERVERLDDFTYLDTSPAEQPGVAYEYWVTFVEPECGGESELCPAFVCEPPPAATPRQG